MPVYTCDIINKNGEKKLKRVYAVSESNLKSKLFAQGNLAVSIIKSEANQWPFSWLKFFSFKAFLKILTKQASVSFYPGKRVKEKKLAAFTRQLSVLLQANMPLLQSINLLINQEKHPLFKITLIRLATIIEKGGSLSEAMKQESKVFNDLYYSMIQAGETSSRLVETLQQLALFLEKHLKVKNKLHSAMIYPSIVIVVAIGTLSFLTLWVIPRFQLLFAEVLKEQSLPPLTQGIIHLSKWINHYGWVILLSFFCLYLTHRLVGNKNIFRLFSNQLPWHIPFVKDFIGKSAIVRFTRAFSFLLQSKIPISKALTMAVHTTGHYSFIRLSEEMCYKIKNGQSLATSLELTTCLPKTVTSMIKIGEETGRLTQILQHIADHYEEEVDRAADNLTAWIEPAIILILALVVGLIVIALFLPIISAMGNIGTL